MMTRIECWSGSWAVTRAGAGVSLELDSADLQIQGGSVALMIDDDIGDALRPLE